MMRCQPFILKQAKNLKFEVVYWGYGFLIIDNYIKGNNLYVSIQEYQAITVMSLPKIIV